MSADVFWFSDEPFAKIAPLLPTKTRGAKRVDDRRVIRGIVHVQKSGWLLGRASPPLGGGRKRDWL